MVLNYNGKKFLAPCLNSLFKVDYPDYEIIVSDNGSTDGSKELVEKLGENSPSCDFFSRRDDSRRNFRINEAAKITREAPSQQKSLIFLENKKNLGFSGGNNAAYRISTGEVVMFMNNDMEVTKDFLKEAIKTLYSEENLACVQSKIMLMDRPTLSKSKYTNYLDCAGDFLTKTGMLYHKGYRAKDNEEFSEDYYIFAPKGACMFWKREVLKKIGLMDDDYFRYFEETDLAWRAWLAGYKIKFSARSILYHRDGGTNEKLDYNFSHYQNYKNRINSIIKNAGIKTLIYMIPAHLIVCFSIVIFWLFRLRDLVGMKALMKGISANIIDLPKTLKKRRQIQKNIRKLKDKEIFKYILKRKGLLSYCISIFGAFGYDSDKTLCKNSKSST